MERRLSGLSGLLLIHISNDQFAETSDHYSPITILRLVLFEDRLDLIANGTQIIRIIRIISDAYKQ
jgi:hypothetical protein